MPHLSSRIRLSMLAVFFALVALTSMSWAQISSENVAIGLPDGTPLDDLEPQALTELNRWRLQKNRFPLQRNPLLDELAARQAEYVMQRQWFSDNMDFHEDAYGGDVLNRLDAEGWPVYGEYNLIVGGENAAYYLSLNGAFKFWRGSIRHRNNVEYNGFREIGIAAYAFRNHVLIYTVFGGRPNVFPVLIDPKHKWAYLTYDRSYYTDGFVPSRVGFYNDEGKRLHTQPWLVWGNRVDLPPGMTEDFVVLQTDGITTVRTNIHMPDSLLYPALPEYADLSQLFEIEPPLDEIVLEPLPEIDLGEPISARGDDYQIRLIYDSKSFALLNNTDEPLDLSGLSVQSDVRSVTATYLSRFSLDPVYAIRSGGCLQAYSFYVEKILPPAPDDCGEVLSVRSGFRAQDRFWLVPTFKVYWYEEELVTCSAEARLCEFDLPLDEEE